MKARVFEVMLHKLPSGKSPASELEDQLNRFLAQSPDLQVVATHMNTIVAPADGRVVTIHFAVGDRVGEGEELIAIEDESESGKEISK